MDKIKAQLQPLLRRLQQLRVLLFVVIVLAVYAFMGMRIASLRNQQPSSSAVSSATPTAQPHIDQATVNKIKQLQDNSVSVQALFNQARQSPFQE